MRITMRFRAAVVALAIASVFSTLPSSSPVAEANSTSLRPSRGSLAVYDGLGTWVDMFNAGMWRHPVRKVRAMHRHGVRTIYIETSNYKLNRRLFSRSKLGLYLHAAHRRGMSVVAWYVPSFAHLRTDLRRCLAAIRFRSDGERFDGFAMDIEATVVRRITTRNHRLRTLSRRLRAHVGTNMALGAIVPNPSTQIFWPRFPYRAVARRYNVFLPMSYWTYHYSGYWRIYRMMAENVSIIRSATRHPQEPVHLIGGIANLATRREVRGMVDSGLDHGVVGGSLYDFPLTKRYQWRQMNRFNR